MKKELQLTKKILLAGFDSEEGMTKWIQKFNSMDGEDAPLFFDECCAYKGLTGDCKPKSDWVEKDGKNDSGGFWWKPYDKLNNAPDDRYCYNHFRWSFESALRVIGDPKYIIVVNLKQKIK